MSVVRNVDGKLEIFGITGAGTIFHRRQLSAGVDSWSDWLQLEGSWLTRVATLLDADGRVELFGVNANGQVFRRAQEYPGSPDMTPWVQLDGILRP
jgi:hypothetical protein